MKTKQFNMKLNTKSINECIKWLQDYQNSLDGKIDKFNEKLANIGMNVVRVTMQSVPDDAKGSYYTEIINDNFGDNSKGCVLRLSGDKVLFAEFGAGVTYSNPQHPLASELGYGVGTYPNQKHAWDMKGWWYSDGTGSHHSYGNKPYMPMYKASLEMRTRIYEIAKEVFNG